MRAARTILATILVQLVLLISTALVVQTTPVNPNQGDTPVIRMSLIVTDGANHSVDDIAKGDLKVFEDKIEQTILLLERDERPFDCGIILDTSQSFRKVLAPALEAVRLIIDNKRPDDEIFIERFISSDKIETLQDFTRDKEPLFESLKSLNVEEGQSAVLDALYLAVEHTVKHAQNNRRQALVLITDGEDRASFYGQEVVVKALRKANVQVFIIGITALLDNEGGLIRQSHRDQAEKLLITIAEESGGRLFLAEKVGELAKAVGEISHDLHGQFALSYRPTNNKKTDRRKVEVKLVTASDRKNWKAIVPRSYYLNAPDASPTPEPKKP
jgi:VWFA-related protein